MHLELSKALSGICLKASPFLLRLCFVCEHSFSTSALLEIRLSQLELCWPSVQFLLELGCSYLELCHSAFGLIVLGSGCSSRNCTAIWPAGCLRIALSALEEKKRKKKKPSRKQDPSYLKCLEGAPHSKTLSDFMFKKPQSLLMHVSKEMDKF